MPAPRSTFWEERRRSFLASDEVLCLSPPMEPRHALRQAKDLSPFLPFWAPNVAKERDDTGYNQVRPHEQHHEPWEDDDQHAEENHKQGGDFEGDAPPPERALQFSRD